MNTDKIPPGVFAVANEPGGPWDGPGVDHSASADKLWTERLHLDYDGHTEEVAHYLDDDGQNSDWFIRWPDGRIERVSYEGESKGFCDENGDEVGPDGSVATLCPCAVPGCELEVPLLHEPREVQKPDGRLYTHGLVIWDPADNDYHQGAGSWGPLSSAHVYLTPEEARLGLDDVDQAEIMRDRLRVIPFAQHAEEVLFLAYVDLDGKAHKLPVLAYAGRNGDIWEYAASDEHLAKMGVELSSDEMEGEPPR